ncbi:MAG TPA: hypothetical protein VJU86_18205 [Pyrinomonadaceae bacterium]|nr:hypothetical protein [Pyrinomonadaceae bacterium]
MRILFDQGTPVPLRHHLVGHEVTTAFELGWSNLENGALLLAAEGRFDLMITTDQNIRYQQKEGSRTLGILVLMTTSWPWMQSGIPEIIAAINQGKPGSLLEVKLQ